MSRSSRTVLAICVVMPMLAYIAGALVANRTPEADRAPIVFAEPTTIDGPKEGANRPKRSKSPMSPKTATSTPGQGVTAPAPHQERDSEPVKKDEPKVVKPRPQVSDDDAGEPDDDDGVDDDDSDDFTDD